MITDRDRHRLGSGGSAWTTTTRSAAGSTSSATCWSQVPYEPLAARGVKTAPRPSARGYEEPNLALHRIPTPF